MGAGVWAGRAVGGEGQELTRLGRGAAALRSSWPGPRVKEAAWMLGSDPWTFPRVMQFKCLPLVFPCVIFEVMAPEEGLFQPLRVKNNNKSYPSFSL